MRKQARKLWLGDWQRDDRGAPPGPDQADTFEITQVEDEALPRAPEKSRDLRRGVVAFAVIGAAFVLAIILFSGGGGGTRELTSAQAQDPQFQAPQQVPPAQVPQTPQGVPPQGFGGADLTGAAAEKAAEAAVRTFPGDVERVTAGPGGGYVVHVIQPDGNEVHVLVDPRFHVQGSDAGAGAPSFGPSQTQ